MTKTGLHPKRLHFTHILAIFIPVFTCLLFWGFFTYLIYQARAAGGSTIVVDFNDLGEMETELVLFPAMLILTFFCSVFLIHEIFTNKIQGGLK